MSEEVKFIRGNDRISQLAQRPDIAAEVAQVRAPQLRGGGKEHFRAGGRGRATAWRCWGAHHAAGARHAQGPMTLSAWCAPR